MKKNRFIIIGTIVIIAIALVFIMIRSLRKNYIIDYLIDKYGDHDFKINSIMKDYDFGNFESLTVKSDGYIVVISTKALKQPFMFAINSNNIWNLTDVSENFVEQYYNETINDYLSKKYKSRFETKVFEKNIKNIYYGHIPTMDELLESNVLFNTNIYVDYKNDNLNDRLQYIKELLLDFTKFLNISKPMQLYLYLSNGNNRYNYNVTIYGDVITIKEGLNTYTYNIYEL